MSISFLERDDYPAKIDLELLDQLTGNDDLIMELTDDDAASAIIDRIGNRYKVADELAKTGDGRNRSLVRWMLNISVYYLFGRAHDLDIPERVVKDYDDTMRDLEKIASGKLSCTIGRTIDAVTGSVPTKIRMGSNAMRSHNPY